MPRIASSKIYGATAATKEPKKLSGKRSLFQSEVDVIKNLLQRRIGILLSDIRDMVNDKHRVDKISNKKVKLSMLEHFQDKIQFCKPEQANKSLLAFSSDLEMRCYENVAILEHCENSCSDNKCLLEADFGLEDK